MYKKLNYATGVLSSGISSSSTEVVLKAGHTITTETGEANKFVGVFFDKAKSSPFQDVNREIVEAYRTDTNKFTIARAKEGTSAKSWVEDDNFMLIASSAVFDEYEAEINNKQDALGFTPENITNKKTTITDSDTDYPTGRAVKTALDGKEPTLTKGNLSGSGVITIDNTRQVIGGAATISHTDSATVRHVTDTEKATWNAKQNALGYTPENVSNKRTSFQATPTDTAYISEKLAKDSLDAKENLANKKTTITDSDDDYPTCKAVKTAVDAKMANPMTTQGDIIYGGSSGTPTRLSKGTAGQVLTMNSSATTPEWSTPKGISWSIVTDDTTMAIDTGSLANKGTLLTLTLPATSAVGKTVRVAGMNAGLWKIAQGANQYIKFGNLSTTVGIGGSLASTQTYDAVELVCIEADKGWVVVSSIGNITVV